MNRNPIMTAYCRYDGEFPCSVNGSTAIDGFNTLGMKIVPFYGFGDVEELDVGPEALIHGYIGDVHTALKKLGLEIPGSVDYPEELTEFLGRSVRKGTLREVTASPGKHVFVKPVAHKLFTGVHWEGSPHHRRKLAPYPDDTPCYIADVVNFQAEYRCFILDREILDVRLYKGDWSKAPARDVVEAAKRAWEGPRAYALDFGVTDDGRTLLVEYNDAYALGAYGLISTQYARMIEARWEELTEPFCE